MAKANGTRSRSGAVSKGPGSREALSTALHRADMVGPRIELDTQDDGPEHRAFPRAKLAVPFTLWIGEGDQEFPRRVAGEAAGDGATLQVQDAELRVIPLRCHSRGREGTGVYVLATF